MKGNMSIKSNQVACEAPLKDKMIHALKSVYDWMLDNMNEDEKADHLLNGCDPEVCVFCEVAEIVWEVD